MILNAELDQSLKRAQLLLSTVPNGMAKATSRAFNRSLQQGRTAATRGIGKRYTVRQKDIRPTFKMKKANPSNMEAELLSTGKRLPLSHFAYRPKQDTTGANRKQIRVGVKKGGLKPLGAAFVWNGKIMQRLGDSSYPIQQKFSLAVPVMLNNQDIVEEVTDTMAQSTIRRLDHETQRLLEGNK